MDGRGRFLDNIFIERLWRSLKYEAVYLYELRDGPDAQRIIGSWIVRSAPALPDAVAGQHRQERGCLLSAVRLIATTEQFVRTVTIWRSYAVGG